MTILFDAARPVKPARPFALGLLPPEPAPAGAPISPADRARFDAAADAAPGGDVACDPSEWPEWTDYHHFNPSPDDRVWWSQETDRIESERADRDLDARAAESAAVDALTARLVPADLPPARPRRPNPRTDRDVARVGAVG